MVTMGGPGGATAALANSASRFGRAIERLSSGLRINRAADDAAGLQMAETLRAQVRGAHQATRNIQDGLAYIQVAEDGIQGVVNLMQRMRELTVQGGNSTVGPIGIQAINDEIGQLMGAFQDARNVAIIARFDFQAPVGARFLTYQVGANKGDEMTYDFNQLAVYLGAFLAAAPTINVNTTTQADTARATIDAVMSGILVELAGVGAFSNRLAHALDVASQAEVQQASAESRIRDADVAREAGELASASLLQRTGSYVLKVHQMRWQTLAAITTG